MINFRLLTLVTFLSIASATFGLFRLDIDTDVMRSLPTGERVISDGLALFEQHPVHDQVAVDIMIDRDDVDLLVESGLFLEHRMEESGLFVQVGIEDLGNLIPALAEHVASTLPLLFSTAELERDVLPHLTPKSIAERIQDLHTSLSSMEGIGQAGFISRDPLGLKDLVLARMAPLAPTLKSQFYRGHLLSANGRHLLVTARPLAGGTDTASARRIAQLLETTGRELAEKYNSQGRVVTLTPVGAYRAALDNEQIIRHDVRLALVLATLGIALLLLFSFSRPQIGLLSLVPALAGTSAALFVYSLLHSSISIMVLGFGGAIISITVDHGIAYLLFLDRPEESRGQEAAHEVRAIGIMAVITTIGAFLILSLSDFPIFVELGRFTALGLLFSFLFVHLVFPRLCPLMPPGNDRCLFVHDLVDALYATGKPGMLAAAMLAIVLLFFARPDFQVSLNSMNTVTEATMTADTLFTNVWGNLGERIFLMHSADSIVQVQNKNDRLLEQVEQDMRQGVLKAAFVPSMIFPGKTRGEQNLAAWKTFWNQQRVQTVKETMLATGRTYGFTADAFADFFTLVDATCTGESSVIPEYYYSLLGISQKKHGSGLIQFVTVAADSVYDADTFYSRYSSDEIIFDAGHFSKRLAEILFTTFSTILVILAVSLSLLLALFYLNLPLTLLTLLPAFFAYICTLGTLHLIGHPLDIPSLMLSIIILGMGIDYAIFCVRAHQRYRDMAHSSYARVRVSIFLAGVSTLIGFGVLCTADHALLRSIGITSFLGIGYSLLGAFFLLPPLLSSYFSRNTRKQNNTDITMRIRYRFRFLEAYPRMFARFKLRLDPLFEDLPQMIAGKQKVETILDIGCGYGVPACWCLEYFAGARIYGIDPGPERVRVASLATYDRGTISLGWAPELPTLPDQVDLVLLLDMVHYLDDETLQATFVSCFQAMTSGGLLVIRFVHRPPGRPSWSWRLEDSRIRFSGHRARYRSAAEMENFLTRVGFMIQRSTVSAANEELVWIVAQVNTEHTDELDLS